MKKTAFRFAATLSLLLAIGSAQADIADDMLRAAKLHKIGETDAAMVIWQRLADRGNADAAYNLAVIHQHGDGVATDYQKAMQWYRQAAEHGDKPSQFQIGLMYQTGQGVAINEAEAHRWYTLHLQHHLHHEHDPKMVAWRKQALALIETSERKEALAKTRSNQNDQLVIAELKRRADTKAEAKQNILIANNSTQ